MIDSNDRREIEKMIWDKTSFTNRQLGDTPNDSLQFTPKKYVNLSGTLILRPASVAASLGQQYYATDLNKPIFFDGNNKWRDATSSVVASN